MRMVRSRAAALRAAVNTAVKPSAKVASARMSSPSPSASTASGSASVSDRARSMSWIIRSSTTETSWLRGEGVPLRTASSSNGFSGMSSRPMAWLTTRSW